MDNKLVHMESGTASKEEFAREIEADNLVMLNVTDLDAAAEILTYANKSELAKQWSVERQIDEALGIFNDPTRDIRSRAPALLCITSGFYYTARHFFEEMPKRDQRRIHGKRYAPGYQLDIDVYTRHWLHANQKNIEAVCPGILAAFEDFYGYEPEESKFLADGECCYAIKKQEAHDHR